MTGIQMIHCRKGSAPSVIGSNGRKSTIFSLMGALAQSKRPHEGTSSLDNTQSARPTFHA